VREGHNRGTELAKRRRAHVVKVARTWPNGTANVAERRLEAGRTAALTRLNSTRNFAERGTEGA
jgi:hypothetical protein